MGWGEETTYYLVMTSGSSLGYSMTEGDDRGGETYTTYFDSNYEWVGNEYDNDYGSEVTSELTLLMIHMAHISLRAEKM